MKEKLILLAVSAVLFWLGSRIAGTTGTLSVLLCGLIYLNIFVMQLKVGVGSAFGGLMRGSVRESAVTGAMLFAYTAPMWVLIALLWLVDITSHTGYASNPIAIAFAIFGPAYMIQRRANRRTAAEAMRNNSDTDSTGQAVTHGRQARDYATAERPTAPAPAAPTSTAPRAQVDYSNAERPTVITPDEE